VVYSVDYSELLAPPMEERRLMPEDRGFWRDERGQDLIEYSLLLAFVCLSGAAMFIGMGQTTRGLWNIVNSRLASANQSS
jgi:Flp pilus assembly pilin Flp